MRDKNTDMGKVANECTVLSGPWVDPDSLQKGFAEAAAKK